LKAEVGLYLIYPHMIIICYISHIWIQCSGKWA